MIEPQKTEIHLRRHPEKKGTMLETPEGEKISLPVEGILQAQAEAAKFTECINIPRAVVFGFTSNQPRTALAGYIFDKELEYLARSLPNSRIFDLQKEGSLEEISGQIDDSVDKIIIVNPPAHPVMGERKWNFDYLLKRLEEINETEFLKEWFENTETQNQAGVTPDSIGRDFKSWIKGQTENAKKLFPNRPVIINAIGHSWELDAGIFALAGRELSSETLEEFGGVIKTMEGAHIVIDPSGRSTIEYRDIKEKLKLD